MTFVRALVLTVLVPCALAACQRQGAPPPPAPVPVDRQAVNDAEIRALLVVFKTSGLSFERNGKIVPGEEAETWLRTKWRRRSEHVKTAEDFIVWVADHSTETKKPYLLVAADGQKTPSADWFRARLADLRR